MGRLLNSFKTLEVTGDIVVRRCSFVKCGLSGVHNLRLGKLSQTVEFLDDMVDFFLASHISIRNISDV